METTAALFEARREYLGWSRAKLAADLGITEMSVYRIEKKGQRPEPELLARLVRTLHMHWEDVERALLGEMSNAQIQEIAQRAVDAASPPDDEITARIARLNPEQRRVFRQLLGLLPDQE